MRKLVVTLSLFVAVAATALAHGGKTHRLMGTVRAVQESRLTVTTTDGKEASARLTAETKYEQAGKPVDRSALVAGARVSIQLDEDDTTALKVKIGGSGGD
jgi:hypothetical protein